MNVIPKFMRFYNNEHCENNEDKENFNPVLKQYSPIKNKPKKRNTVLKELTERNRKKSNINIKGKTEESELGNLFNNMECNIRRNRTTREM
jgi:hypothetical protein